jgi:uncharacterized protein (DUF302 family)
MQNLITASTPESITNAANALRMAVETRGFEFLPVNSLKETIKRNGIELFRECRTFAIYRLEQAGKVLDRASTTLPCLISLYREDGKTVFSTIKPTAFLSKADTQEQQLVAGEIEEMMIGIIEEVCNRKPPVSQPDASHEKEYSKAQSV